MAETCWFCKRNPAEESSAVEVLLHKSVENAKVLIPCCAVCASAHRKAHNIQLLSAILGPIVLLILWIGIGTTLNTQNSSSTQTFTCLFPLTIPLVWIAVPIAVRQYLKSIGTAPEGGKKKHPEVIALLQSGYQMGRVAEPTVPTPAPVPVVNSSGDQPPQQSKLESLVEKAAFDGDITSGEFRTAFEKELDREFGLTLVEGMWRFSRGRMNKTMAAELTIPSVCLEALNEFQKSIPFTQICISANLPISITCNTKPDPTAILTGLDASGGMALIMAAQMVVPAPRKALEYHGMWVIPVRTPIIQAGP